MALKRRIKRDSSATSTVSPTPSQDVAYGTEVGQWDRLNASRMRSKWANKEGAPFFDAPKPDDALTSAFNHVKAKSNQTWNNLVLSMSAAGAHAILSAESFIRCFLKSLPKEPLEAEEYSSWREEVKDLFKKKILDPLSEASSCMTANSFFGNPTDCVNSAILNSFMLNSMGSIKSSSSSPFLAASRRFSQPKSSLESSFSNKSSWKK